MQYVRLAVGRILLEGKRTHRMKGEGAAAAGTDQKKVQLPLDSRVCACLLRAAAAAAGG